MDSNSPSQLRSLSAHNVSFSIGDQQILQDISVELPQHGMTAIVGINGAGKSTLLRILGGIQRPDSGEVRLTGTPVASLPAKKRTQAISFVAQDEDPPAEMTVTDFVALGRLPYQSLFGRTNDHDRQIVAKALSDVSISHIGHKQCGQLSGGQRRRVVLARGIAQEAPFLLLDEPTNHLDVKHQQAILHLARESSASVIAAIHDLDLVLSFFDRVVLLHEGRIYADGAPVEVLTPQVVAEVFGVASHQVVVPTSQRRHLVIDGEI